MKFTQMFLWNTYSCHNRFMILLIHFVAFFLIYSFRIPSINGKIINGVMAADINGEYPYKLNNSNWIVVTTIANPTEDLKKLEKIEDWKVLVVGDEKTPKNWSYPGIIYLDKEQQINLGYKIVSLVPYNSYARKMIGYLFAIQHGAQFIYDTDDDNHPTDGKINFILTPTTTGLIYNDLSRNVMNPLPHFGQENLWPRGYPLELIAIKPNRSYQLCTFKTPAIQQGLVNKDPDLDAVYRLINQGLAKDKEINITFDKHAPPFTLPSGVLAPFNSQNTLFHYDAFWAMFLPTSVEFRVTDIWRGYWAQRLLWLIGRNLAFFPPNAIQFRNAHNYLKDFEEEIQIYEEVKNLTDLLLDWNCDAKFSLHECIINLTSIMTAKNFIKSEDLILMEHWLKDLESVGYKEPIRELTPLNKMCKLTDTDHPAWVYYSPPAIRQTNGYPDLYHFCKEHFIENNDLWDIYHDKFEQNFNKVSYSFDNILLILVFNHPFLENVRFLEALYRDHFPNLVICSHMSNYDELSAGLNSSDMFWRINDITFINLTYSLHGWFSYQCAVRAIEMNYNVEGYLILGDDVLFSPWKVKNFDTSNSKIQIEMDTPAIKSRLFHRKLNGTRVPWWLHPSGRQFANVAIDEIEKISNDASDKRSKLFTTFMQNRRNNNLDLNYMMKSMSDLYFITQKDTKLVTELFKVFLKHKVFLEFAVPYVMVGTSAYNLTSEHGFKGLSLWAGKRDHPLDFFTNETVYLHPLKLREIENNVSLKQNYCDIYMNQFLKNW